MAKQSSGSTEGDAKFGPAEDVRQAAESSLAKARQAVDQYIEKASHLFGSMESSADAARSGTREINSKVANLAEKNINAAFDFAQQLVRAKDPAEIFQLQQSFLKDQVEHLSAQMKELGEPATRIVQSASAAARSKT